MEKEIAAQLAEFTVDTKYRDIPKEVIDFTKGLTLKTFAGMVGGAVKPSSRKMVKIIKNRRLPEESCVIGSGFKTTLWDAVFLNTYFAHASELEDDRVNGGTPWDITVIPVLVSLAEKLKLSGKTLVEALAVGLEVHTRTCMFYTGHLELGVIPGAVGPAAAAAKALGLGAREIAQAMGLALSGVAMTSLNTGSDAHYFESALQSYQGIVAAEMAKEGMTGNPNIGRYLSRLLGKDRVVPEKMVENLGKEWKLREINVKKYPCCILTQRQIDAFLEIKKEHNLSYDNIESVEVHGNRDDRICDRPEPKSEGDLQFCYQHVLAAAMLEGDVNLKHMTEEALHDPAIKKARSKVKVFTNPDLPKGFLAVPARVIVKTNDGKEYTKERMHIIGSPYEPLTMEQFHNLYFKFTRGILSKKDMVDTAKDILNLEGLKDITELMNILTFKCKS